MADIERVTYQGGPLHGAILEMNGALAARVHSMHIVITENGNVVDRQRRQMMPHIRVIQGPQPRVTEPEKPRRARRPRRPRTKSPE